MGIAYTAKNGLKLFKPSIEEIEEGDAEGLGWCLVCGELTTPAEPDARKYHCEVCEERMVYGTMELAMMGLVA